MRTDTQLCGGFHCSLSASERNQWNEYIKRQDTYIHYRFVHTMVQHAISDPNSTMRRTSDNLETLIHDLLNAESALYEVAKYWYNNILLPERKEVEKTWSEIKLDANFDK